MNVEQPLLFLSYSSQYKDSVLHFYDYLVSKNLNVWMDVKNLKIGQNWDFEINKALMRSAIIIMFISSNSVNKRGYVQKEIKIALDKYNEKLVDDIYIIPILLEDDVQIPEELKGVQCARVSSGHCERDIEEAVNHQIGRLRNDKQKTQEKSNVSWFTYSASEEWDGLPGYKTDIQFINLISSRYNYISGMGDIIKGNLTNLMMDSRHVKLNQETDIYDYGQEKELRTNECTAHCGDPFIVGKMITILYSIYHFGSGAAHGNIELRSFCFLLDPVIRVADVREIFSDHDQAFNIIQKEARKQIMNKKYSTNESGLIDGTDAQESITDQEWVNSGTSTWDNFATFVFKENAIEFLFNPYQVAAYVFGPQSVSIPYEILHHIMKREFVGALNISHLKYKQQNEKFLAGIGVDYLSR